MKRNRGTREIRTLLLALMAFGFWIPAETGTNVVLITLDTTRSDHLSCYGYSKPITPNIDALASSGIVFESATTQIPLTGPAHASLLTSLHPRSHKAIRNGVPIDPEVPVLQEILKSRGYATGAFVSGWTLRRNLTGLDRGFDIYDDHLVDRYRVVNSQRFADQTTPLALAWLREHHRQDFLLWVHYFDPHAPYRKHKDFFPADSDIYTALNPSAQGSQAGKIARYDGEIAFVDHHVGILLDELESLGVREETLVVLTADHGESFGEHGYYGHGRRLYESTMKIPMILSLPGRLPSGYRSRYPVQTIDVMPTVFSLLGIPQSQDLEGRDLLPLYREEPSPGTPEIYFETFEGARKKFWRIFSPKLRGIPLRVGKRVDQWKYIYTPGDDRHELYDLSRDPGETRNLIGKHPEYEALAQQCMDRLPVPVFTAANEGLEEGDREKLKSLGYTQ